ncbi:DUF433 domain-containing protein [Oscillatoria sp. FACHB-1406]|uniref:DUF433 domain-containing protein n=1 Tax=Oscillatoria sp. FACHB-1406 TaxID=2692846 RepID=UPI001685B60F|nr:DUF433 domain-containing protein [Oscillatoria sp. FACHB-1406]MBD2580173.1 DUF433 domain-containing protein [Oscillatoria sp. FACHB-1406]
MDIYGGQDPRNIPIYSVGEAARYLKIPDSTIRAWTAGRQYPVAYGHKTFRPLIETQGKKPLRLTFINLIEIHVLRAIRQDHQINLAKVRSALDYIGNELKLLHPLAEWKFSTDGVDLFIDYYGSQINASIGGQLSLKNQLNNHLERIEPDDRGLAIKLYPFTRNQEENNPRLVVIDPRVAFGRMTIAGTGIPTDIITERFHAGDSPEQLVYDYGCELEQIQEAIRCETRPIAV